MSLVKLAAIFVAVTTVSQVSIESLTRRAVLAQSFGGNPDSFPIPSSLPKGTTLKVDGSTSMRFTNEDLENRFEEQFPNVDVELNASRTDEAFKALIDGDIDILATGRPLTEEERSQGVVEIPLEQREKLAIIVGPDNEFSDSLTFEQFARIFRGEITNWSEVGGPDIPIRLVDRPEYSDTRRALSTYTVFENKPFETGDTANPVADDETDSVINALGNDGIGYSVVSQVIERNDVRILPMHQTLPDDPRYPYSQYRAFVYKEDAGPAALAFLGFATTEPGQEVFDSEPTIAAPTTTSGSAETFTSTDASKGVDAPTSTDVTTGTDSAVSPPATTSDPAADVGDQTAGGFPLWLLPLLAIPLLGGLLWWLLKGGGGSGAAGTAATVAGGAAAAVPATAPPQPRMIITPRDCRNAYAYWEIPQERLTEVKRQGGETMMIRLYDVTGRSKNSPLPTPAAEFPCLESNPDLHLPIAVDDRSYCAEVGYLSQDNQWLPIAKSDPVRVPVCPAGTPAPSKFVPETSAAKGITSAGALGGAALGGAALAGAAALGATKLAGGKAKTPIETGRMVLTPRNAQDAYAYWEIPEEQLADAKLQGGETMVTKLYDITDRPADAALPEPTTQLNCTEIDVDTHFPIASEHDYIAEVGYQTTSGGWLPLAQSNSIRVPADMEGGAVTGKFSGAAILGGAAVAVGATAVGANIGSDNLKDATIPAITQSRIVMAPQTSQKAYVYWEAPEAAKSALKAEGGQVYQLRIHDVTDIDSNRQSPTSTLTYDLSETDCDRTVPLPNQQGKYVAEVGYQTASSDWLTLARSTPIQPAMVLSQPLDDSESVNTASKQVPSIPIAAAGAVAAGGLATTAIKARQSEPNLADLDRPDPKTVDVSHQGSTKTVRVHSRNNAVMFDEGQLHQIEHDVASTHQLVPGMYTLHLRDGVFNYDADDNHPGEPFVLLWIHGGTVVNQKTGVPVSSTWTTLNGYDDTLILDVREPAKLCAFFLDTYPDDNSGEVTLSVTKQ